MADRDAVLGAWRVSVQYPDAVPPLRYWGPTVDDALRDWLVEMASVRRVRKANGWPTLEEAILANRLGPVVVTIAPTDWDAA
jgi:hypothetical protein